MRFPHPPLTPLDLSDAPELAVLAALDATLRLTATAIIAANPQLCDSTLFQSPRPRPPQIWIAHAVLAHARALRIDLEHYRDAVDAWDPPADDDPDDSDGDDDIPF